MRTVCSERELDELPAGTVLRFTVSRARVVKDNSGLFRVDGHKGVWMPSDLLTNRTPLEVMEGGK